MDGVPRGDPRELSEYAAGEGPGPAPAAEDPSWAGPPAPGP